MLFRSLTVNRIYIFGLQRIVPFSSPWKYIVRAACRQTIISHLQNLIILTDYTTSNLRIWIFRTHSRKFGNSHEIFIPAYIILSFISHMFLLVTILFRKYGLLRHQVPERYIYVHSNDRPVHRYIHLHPDVLPADVLHLPVLQ